MIRVICSLVALLAGSLSFAQNSEPARRPVEFFKEEITMTISDSTCAVTGVYYFRNNTDKDKPYIVVFPFYVDGVSHYPHEIKAYTVDGQDKLSIEVERLDSQNAVRLSIPMRPEQISVWHLDYVQRIEADYARYILSSTTAWRRPLEEATYRFMIPTNYSIVEIYPKPGGVRRIKGMSDEEPARLELISQQTDFMPTQDMRIFWDEQ